MVAEMDWKIPLFKIYWEEDDIKLVEEAIRRGMAGTLELNSPDTISALLSVPITRRSRLLIML